MTMHIDCPPGSLDDELRSDPVKTRQRAIWSSGDYATIGTTLQIVGESLCEYVDLRAGERTLDVACGNGNATLAAARRFADVAGVDYVPELLQRAGERARADRLDIELRVADAEKLPFGDHVFDVGLSTFGIMFTPNHERAARELARVCRPGGRIGLASWTPEGFVGQLFQVLRPYMAGPPPAQSPLLWGKEGHVLELFGSRAKLLRSRRTEFAFRYRSAEHFVEVFRKYYGPVNQVFESLTPDRQAALAADIGALSKRYDRGNGHALVVPSEYLEIVLEVSK